MSNLFASEINTLRHRAALGRESGFTGNFYSLPSSVQNALFGIAGELEAIADTLEAYSNSDKVILDVPR
jgi:hypothetical protein